MTNNAVQRWRDRASAGRSTLTVEGVAASGHTNPTDVEQLVDNVIDNAIHYAPGPIQIETGSNDGLAFIAIHNNGAEYRGRTVEGDRAVLPWEGFASGRFGPGTGGRTGPRREVGRHAHYRQPPGRGDTRGGSLPKAHTGQEATAPIDAS